MNTARKVRWGVLGAAKIAVEKVIPAMQRGQFSTVTALASRTLEKARPAAERHGIVKVYGSYEELLADPDVDAVYNPLPNHLHVPWTIRAAEAGKHVLCEKPLARSAGEARQLLAVRDRTGVKIQEAFMVRSHPQWLAVRDWIAEGRIGRLLAIQGAFSYCNLDPANVRNVPEFGGGGLLDIGCYPVNTSRFVTGREPIRVLGFMEDDPDFGVDRLCSVLLDFGDVQSSFVCGTQMVPYQRMHFFGSTGRIEIEIPFNAPPDRPCRVFLAGGDLFGSDLETHEFPAVDQYTVQGDLFSRCILENTEPWISLEDSVRNMEILDAVVASARRGCWQIIG